MPFSKFFKSDIFRKGFFATVLTFGILIRFGYQFGSGDHAEFAPFILKLQHPELFPTDFFMQSMLQMGLNERTFFSYFFWPLATWLAPAFFIIYIAVIGITVLGLYQIYHQILQSEPIAWFGVFIITIPFGSIELGAISLLNNSLQGATLSTMLIIWALYRFQSNNKGYYEVLLLVLATLFQPIIGLHAAFILFTTACYQNRKNRFLLRKWALSALIYATSAGAWLIAIYIAQQQGNCAISAQQFMDYTYNFYLDVHFDPMCFSKKGYIFYGICIVALLLARNANTFMRTMLILILVCTIPYLMGYYLNNPFITSLWWFRAYIWVPIIAFPYALMLAKKRLPYLLKLGLNLFILAILATGADIYMNQDALVQNLYHIPGTAYIEKDEELQMASYCKQNTPFEATFIVPLWFTAMPYYGQRSVYASFPRMVRNRCDILEWYRRIVLLYGLEHTTTIARNKIYLATSNAFYNMFAAANTTLLKSKGITHCITTQAVLPDSLLLYSNRSYYLYRIH